MDRKDWNARPGFERDSQMDLQMCLPAFPQKQLRPDSKLLELGIVFHFCIFKMNNLQKRRTLPILSKCYDLM